MLEADLAHRQAFNKLKALLGKGKALAVFPHKF
jgi:hypothetical protein